MGQRGYQTFTHPPEKLIVDRSQQVDGNFGAPLDLGQVALHYLAPGVAAVLAGSRKKKIALGPQFF